MSWKTKRVLEWVEYSSKCRPTDITPPAIMVGKLLLMHDMNVGDVLFYCKQQYILDTYNSSAYDDYWLLVEQNIMESIIDCIISDP